MMSEVTFALFEVQYRTSGVRRAMFRRWLPSAKGAWRKSCENFMEFLWLRMPPRRLGVLKPLRRKVSNLALATKKGQILSHLPRYPPQSLVWQMASHQNRLPLYLMPRPNFSPRLLPSKLARPQKLANRRRSQYRSRPRKICGERRTHTPSIIFLVKWRIAPEVGLSTSRVPQQRTSWI